MSAYDRIKSLCSIERDAFEEVKKEWADEIVDIIQN